MSKPPQKVFITQCQYCWARTGITSVEWGTEDVCDACAAPLLADAKREQEAAQQVQERDA